MPKYTLSPDDDAATIIGTTPILLSNGSGTYFQIAFTATDEDDEPDADDFVLVKEELYGQATGTETRRVWAKLPSSNAPRGVVLKVARLVAAQDA